MKLFEESGKPTGDEAVKNVITQILTNRSLAFHSIDQQHSALSDANFVLDHLDSLNAKALFRRVHAYKQMKMLAAAVKDLETLVDKTPDGKTFAKDLKDCRRQLDEQKKQESEQLKSKKVIEVESDSKGFKKVAIAEDSDDSDDKEEAIKQLKQKKTKQIDEETLKRAQNIAVAE